MRTYSPNSPEAAARILGLMLIADGHLSKIELDLLDRLVAAEQLGLGRAELHRVVHGLCEDLLMNAGTDWAGACRLDERALAVLMAEITDPALQHMVVRLGVALVDSDDHVSDAESQVLLAAVDNWGLQPGVLRPAAAPASAAL